MFNLFEIIHLLVIAVVLLRRILIEPVQVPRRSPHRHDSLELRVTQQCGVERGRTTTWPRSKSDARIGFVDHGLRESKHGLALLAFRRGECGTVWRRRLDKTAELVGPVLAAVAISAISASPVDGGVPCFALHPTIELVCSCKELRLGRCGRRHAEGGLC